MLRLAQKMTGVDLLFVRLTPQNLKGPINCRLKATPIRLAIKGVTAAQGSSSRIQNKVHDSRSGIGAGSSRRGGDCVSAVRK